MASPSLSVIVPCYNAENTIELTLRSLLQQTLRDLEIVVIDDQSQDESVLVVERYARHDGRIRLVKNEKNLGIGSVRNVALAASSAEIVGFVDADDWVTRTFFENLMESMRHPRVDFVRCGHIRVNGTERSIFETPESRRDRDLHPQESIPPVNLPSMVDYPYSWAGLYRKSFLHGAGITFQEGLYSAEDRDFTWRIHAEGRLYRCVSEYGYLYRRESNETLTRTGDRRQLDIFKAIEKILAYVKKPGIPRIWKVKAHRQVLALVVFHHDNRERLRPEVAAEFISIARECVNSMDHELMTEALHDFGSQRIETVRRISSGDVAIL